MKCKFTQLSIFLFLFGMISATAQYTPRDNWKDSFENDGLCWCDNNTNYDHNLDRKSLRINGTNFNIVTVCEELRKHPLYRNLRNGDPIYNDIQCGNGPANDAADEEGCPGRVDLGSSGCNNIGPRFDMDWLSSRPIFNGNGGDNNGDDVRVLAVSIGRYWNVSNSSPNTVTANTNSNGATTFMMESLGNSQYAFKDSRGNYVSSEDGRKFMTANRNTNSPGRWERFTVESLGNSQYAIKGSNGKYVSHENGSKGLNCNRSKVGSWERFTFDGGSLSRANIDNGDFTSKFVAYPNPASNLTDVTLSINLKEDALTTVAVYNVTGQEVGEKSLGNLQAGSSDISLSEITNISTYGLYLVKVNMGEYSFTERVIIGK